MSLGERLGKYFVIRCKTKPFLVAQIAGGRDRPGTSVVLEEFDSSWVDRQLWYTDTVTGVIRSKLNNLCLDIKGDEVVVEPHSATSTTQLWVVCEERIQTGENCEVVLSVRQGPPRHGAPCITALYTEQDQDAGQHWIIQHCPAQYFYIRSQHNLLKVMDVKRDSTKQGAKVIMWNDKGVLADNQLWYEDQHGIIRSKTNGYILDGTSEKEVTVRELDSSNSLHKWIYDGSHIRCLSDSMKVLEYKLGGVLFGEDCVVRGQYKNDQPLQMWRLDLVPHSSSALNHGGAGKYFILRSRSSGLVVEVKEGCRDAGTPLVTGFREMNAPHQFFYVEDISGTIRSHLNDYCVDCEGGQLTLEPYDPYSRTQQWKISGHKIHSREKSDMVWELSSVEPEPGVTVQTGSYTDSDHQQWEKTHVTARSFYIVSKMNDKVMDVKKENASTGASVIMYDRKEEKSANQLWYEDENGVIRSRLNGYVMDSTKDRIKMEPFDPSNTHQYWLIVGDRIQNKYDNRLVLDIQGEGKSNCAPVCAYRYMGGDNQRWRIEFIEPEEEETKTSS